MYIFSRPLFKKFILQNESVLFQKETVPHLVSTTYVIKPRHTKLGVDQPREAAAAPKGALS